MELPDRYFENTEDIMRAGIIGNYVHGNEPSHHIPYFYNFTSQPWKTQRTTRLILRNQYNLNSEGMGGNDDCGQMSAWYIFSALGFYPFAPGSTDYSLTTPLIKEAKIQLDSSQILHITTENNSEGNMYIQAVYWQGKRFLSPSISHLDLMKGGELRFVLGPNPAPKAFN